MTSPVEIVTTGLLPAINVVVKVGRPWSLTVPVLDSADAPLAGVTAARAHVRAAIDSDETLHVFSTAEANIAIVGTDLVITATSAETSDWQLTWPRLVAYWDIEITDGDDIPSQITDPGTITLDPEVTR